MCLWLGACGFNPRFVGFRTHLLSSEWFRRELCVAPDYFSLPSNKLEPPKPLLVLYSLYIYFTVL